MSIQTNASNALAAYDDGYQAGLKEGRRLERVALRRDAKSKKREGRMLLNDWGTRWIEDWLASRTKPAKRKEDER
jgi:hypothetical protein